MLGYNCQEGFGPLRVSSVGHNHGMGWLTSVWRHSLVTRHISTIAWRLSLCFTVSARHSGDCGNGGAEDAEKQKKPLATVYVKANTAQSNRTLTGHTLGSAGQSLASPEKHTSSEAK